MQNLIEQLIETLGPEAVTPSQEIDRVTSYWDSSPVNARALVRPKSTEQVSQVLKLCHQYRQPVVTVGGSTNCVAATKTAPDEILLSTERLDQIEHIDTANGTATVQAGVILEKLQQACLSEDRIFPLDLGARGSCTIGGNAATNAGGINVLRYGMARNLILGMEVVLADGTVLSNMNQMLKNNSGYDLKQLFIGTEGSLGVITRLVVRIFPRPVSRNTALLALNRFDQVIALLGNAQQQLAGTLSAFEVMWGNYMGGVTAPGAHKPPFAETYPYSVILESEGTDIEADEQRFNTLLENCHESTLIADAIVPKSENDRLALWAIREQFEPVLKPGPVFLYDISLPITAMEHYLEALSEALQLQWPEHDFYVFGHVADGNLHLFIRPNQPGEENAQHQQSDALVYELLQRYNGAISAEHGIGSEKRDWLHCSRSDAEIALMRQLKATLDPDNILNPARVLA